MKTNILFFKKGSRTERVWYYDLSDVKVNKSSPFTINKLDEFFALLPKREDSERSWTVDRQTLEDKDFDLKAVNPWVKPTEDEPTLSELLNAIEDRAAMITTAVGKLKQLLGEVDE